ncbi:patatin-like phospholipase family protein [Amycolatopsis sp. GM8]|uniref:patatin-like phospholipase family protein n=1 Tax=Amycolatopsis sp. GM8 TaxID=2896530 RepID=UPI001F002740|nr:patatin-like phospholipase family protein [Amycolatopsis sp. GM8]
MTTALVLGGGGPLGIAWQSGLLTALARRGIDLSRSDLILGTSAGSVVGATLAAGLDLASLLPRVSGGLPLGPGASGDISGLPELAIKDMIDYALSADTIAEEHYLGRPLFAEFAGIPWPSALRCTGVDTRTGRLTVWDADSGVDLPTALAASCAVPGLFPPVTIHGTRYVDGGVINPLNVDLAGGHHRVVAISCFPATEESGVTLVQPGPEFLAISEWGAAVMDTARSADAYEAGLRQADRTSL